MIKVSLQLYNVRYELQKDLGGTLQKVREAGYSSVSLAGTMGHDCADVVNELRRNSLDCVSAHVPLEEVLATSDKCVDLIKGVGAKWCVIPWTSPDVFGSDKDLTRRLTDINKVSEIMARSGIKTLYHNHHCEFLGSTGSTPFEVIMKECNVDWQVDGGWLSYADVDTEYFLNTYRDRIKMFQFKDMKYLRPADESVYQKASSGVLRFDKDGFEFAPVGKGKLDCDGYRDFVLKNGINYVEVEQDQSPAHDPFDDAKVSLEKITSLFDGR